MAETIQGKNYYEILGITRDAPEEQIREVYRDLARIYHPDSRYYQDIVNDSISAEHLAIFKAITAAYTTLIHPQSRREYDKGLPSSTRDWQAPDWTCTDTMLLKEIQRTTSIDHGAGIDETVVLRSAMFGRMEPTITNRPDDVDFQPMFRLVETKAEKLRRQFVYLFLGACLGLSIGIIALIAFHNRLPH